MASMGASIASATGRGVRVGTPRRARVRAFAAGPPTPQGLSSCGFLPRGTAARAPGRTAATATTASVVETAVLPATGTGTTAAVTAAGIRSTPIATATTTAITTTRVGTSAVTTAAIATAAATWGGPTGLGFVDPQRTTHQLNTLKRFDRCGFGSVIGHFNEREAPFPSRVSLKGKGTVRDLSMRGEQFNDVFLLSTEGQIANKNAHLPRGPWVKGTDGT